MCKVGGGWVPCILVGKQTPALAAPLLEQVAAGFGRPELLCILSVFSPSTSTVSGTHAHSRCLFLLEASGEVESSVRAGSQREGCSSKGEPGFSGFKLELRILNEDLNYFYVGGGWG